MAISFDSNAVYGYDPTRSYSMNDITGGESAIAGNNWTKAFSGIDGLVSAAPRPNAPGVFDVVRNTGNGEEITTATLNPSTGTVATGTWAPHTVDSFASLTKQFAPVALAALGGLSAVGALGTGAATTGGLSGMDLAADAALGSGNNIITAGSALGGANAAAGGLTLANAANGGVPMATNATNPALIDSAAGTAGYGASSAGAGGVTSSLPSWLTSGIKSIGGKLATTALLGGALGAGLSNDTIDTASRQGIADTLGQYGLEQGNIARSTYTDALNRIAGNDQTFSDILSSVLSQAQQQGDRSNQTWDTYTNDFLPAAQKYAQTAMNYDTEGRRAEADASARAAVETEANAQRQAQQRMLSRAGLSLDSGRALALDQQSRFDQTKNATGAAAAARQQVEDTGLNLLANTANLGSNIANLSQTQAGQAVTANNAATSAVGAKESARNSALSPTSTFYSGATSATGNAGNVLNGVASTEAQNKANESAGWAGLGNLAGTLLTAGKDSVLGSILSDPAAKNVQAPVDGEQALNDMESEPVSLWSYKPGMGDGGTHVGRMAGEGDPTGPDGLKRIDVTSELGKHQAAITQLSRDVKQINRRLSLADI